MENKSMFRSVGQMTSLLIPRAPRWAKAFKALSISTAIIVTVLYCIGLTDKKVADAVWLVWRITPGGVLDNDYPYYCNSTHLSLTGGWSHECDAYAWEGHINWGAGGTYVAQPDLTLYLYFILGSLFSLRIACYMMESLEDALGVDLLSRVLDRFLPASTKSGEPPAKTND